MLEWRAFSRIELLDFLREGRLMDFGSWSRVSKNSSLSDPLLDQFIEAAKVGRPAVLRVPSSCTGLF